MNNKPKRYRLIQTLLMPGRMPIILPIGYSVKLCEDMYIGEGGWMFAPTGVENNKLHWEEIIEPQEFVWTDELVVDMMMAKVSSRAECEALVQNYKKHKHFDSECLFNIKKLNEQLHELRFKSPKKYTQQELDKHMKQAWDAARTNTDGLLFSDKWFAFKYPTLHHYYISTIVDE